MSFVVAPELEKIRHPSESSMLLLRSSLLNQVEGIEHGFTTRHGGISEAPRDSLNLGRKLGDSASIIRENRNRVLNALGVPNHTWVSITQVHGNEVVEVTPNANKAIEADGLWTRSPEAALAVTVADCVPLLFAHQSGQAVAAVHAGWRGTVANIAAEMVTRFKKAGFASEELVVALGPGIGPCCFEIGAEVIEAIEVAFPSLRSLVKTDGGKGRANLWDMNRIALEKAGILSSQIDVIDKCTSCTPDLFSYRRDQGSTGRQAGVIARF
uniref:Purine nucleoside phosphorylase n=1 Tax=uncultured myxobacterium HF0200_19H16 TaxID=723559 RepID=E7C3X5_9BACT|nr:uncharacterized conserved protein [uncultured myxobacterium HF0200_19H16]